MLLLGTLWVNYAGEKKVESQLPLSFAPQISSFAHLILKMSDIQPQFIAVETRNLVTFQTITDCKWNCKYKMDFLP